MRHEAIFRYILLVSLVLVLMIDRRVLAVSGEFDPTFGDEGKVIVPVPNGPYQIRVLPNGKIVMTDGSYIAIYYPDGTPDRISWIETDESAEEFIWDIAIQSDGKIVAVGARYDGNTCNGPAAFRFNANGERDPTFGDNDVGVRCMSVLLYGPDLAARVALQADGKIVVALAQTWLGLDYELHSIFRMNPDGSGDPTFVWENAGHIGLPIDLLVQPDNKIVVEGVSYWDEPSLRRYQQNGSPDIAFGVNGRFDLQYLAGMAYQPGDKIILFRTVSSSQSTLVRTGRNASYDPSFGRGGVVSLEGPRSKLIGQIAVQNDGKILAAGSLNDVPAIARLTANGTDDATFGNGGLLKVPLGSSDIRGGFSRITLQPDGKIVGAGYLVDENNRVNSVILVRLLNKDSSKAFDFDGDGKADQGVFRPAEGVWYLLQSRDGFVGYGFGLAGDRLVADDYDGDGKTDVSIYRDGVWWVLKSSDGGYTATQWGLPSDTPVPADYDGDGKADLAVYRDGTWWILYGNGAGYTVINWGIASDKPVPADYDGDGKTDFAVYRGGEWWILFANGSGYTTVQWGIATDKPIPSDFDGDGKADFAVYRDGEWWILNTLGQPSMIQWGIPGDQPVPADYDGDGKTDPAIYRNGEWWTLLPTGYTNNTWGIPNDIPVPRRD